MSAYHIQASTGNEVVSGAQNNHCTYAVAVNNGDRSRGFRDPKEGDFLIRKYQGKDITSHGYPIPEMLS